MVSDEQQLFRSRSFESGSWQLENASNGSVHKPKVVIR